MTYVLSWIHQDSVFCIADTAITHFNEPTEPYSSFGEIQTKNYKGEVVEEIGVKIIPLTKYLAISYSGDVTTARKIIYELKIKLSYMNYQDSLTEIIKLNPSLMKENTKFLIMGFDEKKGPFLHGWYNKQPDSFHSYNSWASMGSLKLEIRVIIENFLQYMKSGNIDQEHLLQSMLAFMQYLGIHNPLMETNVGGGIFGSGIGPNGFFWHKDITYILYPPDLSNFTIKIYNKEDIPDNLKELNCIDIITCLVRDNVWITSSSIIKHPKILMLSESMILNQKEWLIKWNKELKEYFDFVKSQYFAFISKIEGNIILIKNPNILPDNKFFRIERKERRYNFFIKSELMTELMYKPQHVPPDEKYFKFSFKNG